MWAISPWCQNRRHWWQAYLLLGIVSSVLCLSSCRNSGEEVESLEPPSLSTPATERQVIMSLLDLYRTALEQEDIDRSDRGFL